MNSNDNFEEPENEFRSAAMDGKWPKVLKMYEDKRELRTTRVTDTGDTVLHMAVSNGKLHVVETMVDLVCGERVNEKDKKSTLLLPMDENGDEKELVFGAENDKGNTPLHLAASMGEVGMCKKISDAAPFLIVKRNHTGETPLFMAALHGHRIAFLWLHYRYWEKFSTDSAHYCIRRDSDDTILHCALEKGHIDVAIEIVHLYKHHLKEMIKRNKNGLSPLHLLAANPSAFKSINDLPGRSFVAQLLYRSLCFRVKKKKQAATREELEGPEREPRIWALFLSLWDKLVHRPQSESPCWKNSVRVIGNLLGLLVIFFPLMPLVAAEHWIHGIRNRKEKLAWSDQIVEELLQQASDEDMSGNPYEEESEAGSKIVDTPLMIAAKNGVIEIVEKIVKSFPSAMKVANEEGKNTLLLAAEKRQTKVYKMLCENEKFDKSAFRQVDKDGNTALHLAAKLGVSLNGQATTMVDEFKWFEFVKSSLPSDLWEKYNNDGKTAEEIFRESYKEHMTSDRQWLNQTSQTCSVASTLVASMAFSYIVSEKFDEKNYLLLVALSLSLTSTISFLAILAFRSQSLNFWRYAPFMLQIAILTMFGSIVSLWISLMLLGKSLTIYAILGSPIAILTILSLPIFIGPTLMSLFTKVPPPNPNITSAIRYRRPLQRKENETNFAGNQEPTPNITFRANHSLQDIQNL